MSSVLLSLALLACPVGMGVMVWMMGRGRKREDLRRAAGAQPPSMELLREEHRRLGAEIERLKGDDAASEPAAPARR